MSGLPMDLAGYLGGDDPTRDPQQFPVQTDADLLAILDQLLPDWYLDPLKDPGPGYEWFQAVASMMARASLATARTEACLFARYAHGGALSRANVELFRDSALAGAFTVKAGTVVRASSTSRSFQLTYDVPFGPTDVVVAATVTAVAPAPEYDVSGPVVTADGTVLPGEIDSVVLPVLDPVFAEPTLQVRQVADAIGGAAPVLDQLGLDRDLPRLGGEPDDVYRRRVGQLPDTVSPAALRRQLDAVFRPIGLSYQLIETWQNEYQTCYDFPNVDLVHPTMGRAAADCFVLDDPRVDPFRGRLLDERDFVGGLVAVVPEVGSWSQRGFAYDDELPGNLGSGTLGPSSTFARVATTTFQNFAMPGQNPVLTSTSVWSATFRAFSPGDGANATVARDGTGKFLNFGPGVGIVATFQSSSGAPTFVEVRDRQFFDLGTSSWVSCDGAVGLHVKSDIAVSTAWLETVVANGSVLLELDTPDPDPRKAVTPAFLATTAQIVAPCTGGISSNETARGWRARSALDAPDLDGDPTRGQFVRVPFLDGGDALHDLFYKSVFDLLTKVKGGGTNSAVELEGQ